MGNDFDKLFNVIITGAIPTVTATVATPKNDPNIRKCAQDAFKKHSGDLKDLLSRSKAIFQCMAGACKEVKIISGTEYDEIFDDMTHQTLAERVDKFLEGIILVLKYHFKQLGVFLNILIDKGNIAFVVVAERIAQSCKLNIIFSLIIKVHFIVNTEVPDQYHIILTES